MARLALKKIEAFSGIGHGFYFWNFRTDLYEPQWSYMAALDRGWIPRGNLNDQQVRTACAREDVGAFRCILKHGQIDKAILGALGYIYGSQNLTDTPEAQKVLSLTGSALQTAASEEIEEYFQKFRVQGVTCDFGGIAMLIEENRTLTDDDSIGLDDDEYFVVYKGPPIWILVLVGVIVASLGAIAGFVVAMRYNPSFNRRVQSTALFKPLSRSSLVRSSCKLDDYYDEIKDIAYEYEKET